MAAIACALSILSITILALIPEHRMLGLILNAIGAAVWGMYAYRTGQKALVLVNAVQLVIAAMGALTAPAY